MSTILKNFSYKFIALGLALLVWLYVAGQKLQDIVRKVPLTVEMESEGMTIVGNPVRELSVTFTVPVQMVNTLSAADITARHKIKPDRPVEQYTFRVAPEDIKGPPGHYRTARIDPDEITVRIDQINRTQLPVKVQLHGDPAAGYKVVTEGVVVDPKEILVSGPEQKLQLITTVLTEPIDVVGRTMSFRKRVSLQPYVDIRPEGEAEIEVFVPIAEEFGARRFSELPVHVVGLPYEMLFAEVEPSKLDVDVSGPTRMLDEIKPGDLLVFVDISGLKRGEYELPFAFRLPYNVSFKEELPLAHVKIGEVKIK